MNIMNWRPLVLTVCERYSTMIKANLCEYQDAIQAGMLGLVLAKQQYVGKVADKWTFMAVARMHIRNEIQKLLFTDAKSRSLRTKEAPLSPEMVIQLSGVSYDKTYMEIHVQDFCDKLPLGDREKQFFRDIVECGSMEAGKMYMEETGMTRQGMGLRRKQVITCAQELYAEVV